MKSERSFPPGIGWLPYTIAILLALMVAAFAAAPQFSTKIVGSTGAVPGADQAVASADPGTTTAPGGTVTHTTGGAAAAAAAPGSVAANHATGIACAPGRNGGATDKGVTATQIHVASTIVTTGIGSGFLGEAADGIKAAIAQVNQAGGICGRRLTSTDGSKPIETINDGWDGPTGESDIQAWCQGGNVFALVGEPDSEGLRAALGSGTIDSCRLPVVGTDGMLSDQYWSPWVWPVAASTVTNMHIAADYAVKTLHANTFGIIYDNKYKFGQEGANAFCQQLHRLGKDVAGGCGNGGNTCQGGFCGIDGDKGDYGNQEIPAFNADCKPCDVVVMLLEPKPAEEWVGGESGSWYVHLMGGEPLFDDQVGGNCPGCGQGKMQVWTGYHAASQPFDSEKAVYTYCQALQAIRPADDCHNEFTEGAYLGTMMFIKAVQTVGDENLPLTRDNLRAALDSQTFDLGLSQPLHYGSSLPHLANTSMAAFSENYSGTFNGWNYDATGFLPDPAPGQELVRQ